ncbi:MAG: CpaF family protein [Deltaproteobacteria bacterium]|nr:CpaF family protein [Deltaproteobacteria bacterium]
MQKINLAMLDDARSAAPLPALTVKTAASRVGLSPALSHILQHVRRERDSLQTGEAEGQIVSSDQIATLIREVAQRLGFELTSYEIDEVMAQIEREQKPFGVLQPLVDDPEVSDIIVSDYSKIAVQQGRRNITTDYSFPDQSSYENFVERLLMRAGATYSTKKPIADGMIGSLARVHAVHSCMCEGGPYLTIRLNRFRSVSVDNLIESGAAPAEVFSYLQAIIEGGQTVLVVGEVGTGKTTLVRALASGIGSDESILVIEDTPEIKLEHPQARYITTRESNSDGAGRITPAECIRAGMRMAMNRIIFGEMRDAEAAEAFIDVCASGHPGLSTIHAKSAAEAITRLELFLGRAQKGVSRTVIIDQIATAVQVIVFVDICRISGRRRIMQVREIGPVADGVLRSRDLFQYHHGITPGWRVLSRVSAHREVLEAAGVNLSEMNSPIELSITGQFKEAISRHLHQ